MEQELYLQNQIFVLTFSTLHKRQASIVVFNLFGLRILYTLKILLRTHKNFACVGYICQYLSLLKTKQLIL